VRVVLNDLDRELSAIVTVSDDGGRFGRLREELQCFAGDIRHCMIALLRIQIYFSRLFRYPFRETVNLADTALAISS